MSKTAQLSTFDEADAALRALGEAQRELVALELAAQAKIDAAKARLAEDRIGADAVIKSTVKLLTKFVVAHQQQIEERGGKTVRLVFGRIGMRTAPAALKLEKGFTEADVIAWLRNKFPKSADAYIRVAERLDRDELKLWDEAELAEVGLRIEQEELVVIEPADDVPVKDVA